MTSFIKLSIFVILFYMATGFEIPICCPDGYKFVESTRGLFRSSKFECLQTGGGYSQSSQKVYGFNVRYSNRSEIPSCWDPILIKITDEVPSLSTESCVFELDGILHAVMCLGNGLNKVSVIKKCCPIGQSYDSVEKMCVESDLGTDVFDNLFDHSVIFTNNSFDCPDSGVIVEYFSKNHDFSLQTSDLNIRDTGRTYSSDSFCVESVLNYIVHGSTYSLTKPTFMARTCNSALVCNKIPCIRRCCNDKEKYVRANGTSVCAPHPVDHNIIFHKFDPDGNNLDGKFQANRIEPREFGILRGQNCQKYILEPAEVPEDEHFFHYDDGSLHLPQPPSTYENSEYCIEFVHTSPHTVEPFTFICFEENDGEKLRFGLYPIGLLVSCGFSAVTLFVYLCVPKLQNLPGKILICLVCCLFASYLGMAIGQIFPTGDKACYPFAFSVYFSLMAAFSWMNVMCFDIWITFSSSQRSHRLWKSQERRRFMFYSLYGWGLPVLLTVITIALDQLRVLPKDLRLKFGGGRCWFENINVAAHLVFFLGPAGILILCNFILFILTLKYCNKVKREIDRMQSSNSEKPVLRKRLGVNKARFMMNLKLFVVMGASWILEIISTAFYDRKYAFVWVVADFYNALQGVLVFLIFVFKWKVWYLILDRLGVKHKNRFKTSRERLGTTTVSLGGSTNLLRMKSMENCSSLLNQNVSLNPKVLKSLN